MLNNSFWPIKAESRVVALPENFSSYEIWQLKRGTIIDTTREILQNVDTATISVPKEHQDRHFTQFMFLILRISDWSPLCWLESWKRITFGVVLLLIAPWSYEQEVKKPSILSQFDQFTTYRYKNILGL